MPQCELMLYYITSIHTAAQVRFSLFLSQNVVVVGQPTSGPDVQHVAIMAPRAAEFNILTTVLCVLCLIHLNIVFSILLIPALVCSITVSALILTN